MLSGHTPLQQNLFLKLFKYFIPPLCKGRPTLRNFFPSHPNTDFPSKQSKKLIYFVYYSNGKFNMQTQAQTPQDVCYQFIIYFTQIIFTIFLWHILIFKSSFYCILIEMHKKLNLQVSFFKVVRARTFKLFFLGWGVITPLPMMGKKCIFFCALLGTKTEKTELLLDLNGEKYF